MRNKLLLILLVGILFSCQSDFSDQALSEVCHSLREEQKEITTKMWSTRKRAKIEVDESGGKSWDMRVLYQLEKGAALMDPLLYYLDSMLVYDTLGQGTIHYPQTFFQEAKSFSDSMRSYSSDEEEQKQFQKLLTEQEKVFQKINSLNGSARAVELLMSKNKFLFHEKRFEHDLGMRVGGSHCGFLYIMAAAEPESKIVEEGKRYNASIYLGLSAPSVYPVEATLNGESVLIKPGFHGKVPLRITTKVLAEKDSIVKKRWKMSVTIFDKEFMNDTTIVIERDYFVKKNCQ